MISGYEISSEANTTTPVCKVSLQVMVGALRMRTSYHLGNAVMKWSWIAVVLARGPVLM